MSGGGSDLNTQIKLICLWFADEAVDSIADRSDSSAIGNSSVLDGERCFKPDVAETDAVPGTAAVCPVDAADADISGTAD